MLATAKDLQREVRDMARRIGHVQQPAYYDEFIESESFYVDPLKNPKRGWSPLCASPPVAPTAEVWTHNGSTLFMVSDGNRRRLHYIDPRPVIRDNGVKPNCLLIDGEIVGTKFVGKAHIYRVQCGMFAYDVTGEYADGAVRLELNGPGPEPLFNCRVTRLDASSRNARLVFERVPAPPPQASTPVAPAQ